MKLLITFNELPRNLELSAEVSLIKLINCLTPPSLDKHRPFSANPPKITRYVFQSTQILLAIGGWSFGTQKFKEMSGTRYARQTFIYSAIPYLRQRGFDGKSIIHFTSIFQSNSP
jgi:hypothetical protein